MKVTAQELKSEIAQSLTWAEYANDYGFELYDKEIAPLDSEYFDTSDIKALYNYCLEHQLSESDLFITQLNEDSQYVITLDSRYVGLGHNVLEAFNDLLRHIIRWDEMTCGGTF